MGPANDDPLAEATRENPATVTSLVWLTRIFFLLADALVLVAAAAIVQHLSLADWLNWVFTDLALLALLLSAVALMLVRRTLRTAASPLDEGKLLAGALERVRIHTQAAVDTNALRTRTGETDSLTKLFNRRRLDVDLAHDAATLQTSSGNPFAFVMADVDHFKEFNDSQGHPKGDEVLRELAQVLKDSIRGQDTAYRYGGEEFSLILRQIDPLATSAVVERIRHNVEVRFQALGLSVTASFGVALAPHCGSNPVAIIAAADHALYRSKNGGRNRITLAAGLTK